MSLLFPNTTVVTTSETITAQHGLSYYTAGANPVYMAFYNTGDIHITMAAAGQIAFVNPAYASTSSVDFAGPAKPENVFITHYQHAALNLVDFQNGHLTMANEGYTNAADVVSHIRQNAYGSSLILPHGGAIAFVGDHNVTAGQISVLA